MREFFPDARIIVHPPVSNYLRAGKKGDVLLEALDYLPRDRKIVDSTECLIGCPKSDVPAKSGSWYTINYGKKINRPVYHLVR